MTARPVTRRAFVALCAAGAAGCTGGGGSDAPTPAPDNPAVGDAPQRGDLELTSPAFDDGGRIPRKYGRSGENVNPPLSISGVPDGAASLVLIVDDPDAVEPAGTVWLHWLVWNVGPPRTAIPEGWEPDGAVVGENDFGNRRYDGPDPPDGEHTYRFKLYALGSMLDPPGSASEVEVGEAMRGAILARTQLEGTFAPA